MFFVGVCTVELKRLLEMARGELRSKNFEQARSYLDQARNESPHHVGVLRVSNDLFRQQGDREAAVEAAQLIVRHYPEQPDGYTRLAQNFIALKEFQQAQSCLEQARDKHPRHQLVLRVANDLHRAQGDRQGAFEVAALLAQHHPDQIDGHLRAAQDLMALKEFDRARAFLDQALAVEPDHLNVVRTANDFFRATGDRQSAFEMAQRLIDKHPDQPDGYTRAALDLVALKDIKQAGLYLDQAAGRFPDHPSVLRAVNDFHRAQGHRQQALEAAQRLVEQHPDNANGYVKIIQDLIALKDFEQAKRYLDQALIRHTENPGVMKIASDFHRAQGDSEAALDAAHSLIERYPNEADGYIKVAKELAYREKHDEAKRYLDQARAVLGEGADVDSQYIETLIRVYGVLEACKRLKPLAHNAEFHKNGGSLQKKYAFVSGVPRSGTSALGKILHFSKDIAIFNELHNPRFAYSQGSFERKLIEEMAKTHPHQDKLIDTLDKLDTAAYVGDKRPNFYWRIGDTLRWLKGETVFVFNIVRPLPEVCRSFQARADNPNDRSWNVFRDHRQAIDDFNAMCRCFLDTKDDNFDSDHHVIFVPYDKVFTDLSYALSLFERLNPFDIDELPPILEEFIESSKKIVKKERVISEEIQQNIAKYADFDAIRRFENLSSCPCL